MTPYGDVPSWFAPDAPAAALDEWIALPVGSDAQPLGRIEIAGTQTSPSAQSRSDFPVSSDARRTILAATIESSPAS